MSDTPYHQATKKIVGRKQTSVFALITPDSVWVDEPGGKVPLVDTLMVIEGDKVIHWSAPYDIELPADTKLPPGVPKITPKLEGQGIFTRQEVKKSYEINIAVRKYSVKSVDELIELANASRQAAPAE